jgi:hypothetical protein
VLQRGGLRHPEKIKWICHSKYILTGKKWYDQSLLDMKNTLDTLSIKLTFNPFDKGLNGFVIPNIF